MARKRKPNFNYSPVEINGHTYLKTYIPDEDGKHVIIYGKTLEAGGNRRGTYRSLCAMGKLI